MSRVLTFFLLLSAVLCGLPTMISSENDFGLNVASVNTTPGVFGQFLLFDNRFEPSELFPSAFIGGVRYSESSYSTIIVTMFSRISPLLFNFEFADVNPIGDSGTLSLDSTFVADFDKDGIMDVISTTRGFFWGDGTYAFTSSPFPYDPNYGTVYGADFDQDGDLDVLFAGFTGTVPDIRYIRNDGGRVWTDMGANGLLTEFGQVQFAVGDFNNDGYPDVFLAGATTTANNVAKEFYAWVPSTGMFSRQTIPSTEFVKFTGASDVIDVDGDGDLDIAQIGVECPFDNCTSSTPSRLMVNNFETAGAFSFTALPISDIRTQQIGFIRFVDFNRDGVLDIYQGGTRILFNTASGPTDLTHHCLFAGLTATTFSTTCLQPGGLGLVGGQHAVTDLNGDGYPEMFGSGAFDYYDTPTRYYEQRTTAFDLTCTADCVDVRPILSYIVSDVVISRQGSDGTQLRISWTAPTRFPGLSFNVFVREGDSIAPGLGTPLNTPTTYFSGVNETDRLRQYMYRGNAYANDFYLLNNVPTSTTVTAFVQTIDANFNTGRWSEAGHSCGLGRELVGTTCVLCEQNSFAVLGQACEECPAGKQADSSRSKCVSCSSDEVRAKGESKCEKCSGDKVANSDNTKCVAAAVNAGAIGGGVAGGVVGLCLLCCCLPLLLCLACIPLIIILIVIVVVIVLIAAVIIALLLAAVGVLGVFSRRVMKRNREMTAFVDVGEDGEARSLDEVKGGMGGVTYRELDWDELKIKKKLGEGAFGKVFRGRWRGADVAIKTIQVINVSDMDEATMDEFRREASLMEKLGNHPNVISFVGAVTKGGHLALVTEFCANGSLYDLLFKSGKEVSEADMVRMARDAAAGLVHLHSEGVIHRDIAARNILVAHDNTVRVADFGMSRVVDKAETTGSTKSNIGPVRWMAPEAIRYKRYSEKSDVWSFGVLLWEMWTKKEPFEGIALLDVAMGVSKENLRLEVPDDMNRDVANLIKRCFADEPEDRPEMSQIVEELTKIYLSMVGEEESSGSSTEDDGAAFSSTNAHSGAGWESNQSTSYVIPTTE